MDIYESHYKLACSDEELKEKFRNINTFNDVAGLLEISPKHLHYILFKQAKNKQYYEFEIPKKNKENEFRRILAPNKSLKILQQKLNYIFSLVYETKITVHGFTRGRSIVSNAEMHLNKKHVLNFDIENFFNSINFGRVRGVLISYFNMGANAATAIANICCYNNSLPQGAPTSPILSNMVCFNLDKEMQYLAKRFSCIYTRYADDITLSTTKNNFPKSLAYVDNKQVILGDVVTKILEENGFKINDSKTRLRNRNQRLEVTGITVNEKLNVNRNYIKKIRAILRSIETNGIETAQELFVEKYNKKSISLLNVVFGMINYVKMVRGKNDDIFGKLARRYNNIIGNEAFDITKNPSELRVLYTWVVEIGIEDGDEFYPDVQGTGFFVKDIGFVTNAHVVSSFKSGENDKILVHRSRYSAEKFEAHLVYYDSDIDIAILEIQGFDKEYGFDYCIENYESQEICLLGYPNHNLGDSLNVDPGHIKQYRNHYMPNVYNEKTKQLGMNQERIIISSRIVIGNSGGPVVNNENEVIGVATKGHTSLNESNDSDSTAIDAVVPIKDVIELVSKKSKEHIAGG